MAYRVGPHRGCEQRGCTYVIVCNPEMLHDYWEAYHYANKEQYENSVGEAYKRFDFSDYYLKNFDMNNPGCDESPIRTAIFAWIDEVHAYEDSKLLNAQYVNKDGEVVIKGTVVR